MALGRRPLRGGAGVAGLFPAGTRPHAIFGGRYENGGPRGVGPLSRAPLGAGARAATRVAEDLPGAKLLFGALGRPRYRRGPGLIGGGGGTSAPRRARQGRPPRRGAAAPSLLPSPAGEMSPPKPPPPPRPICERGGVDPSGGFCPPSSPLALGGTIPLWPWWREASAKGRGQKAGPAPPERGRGAPREPRTPLGWARAQSEILALDQECRGGKTPGGGNELGKKEPYPFFRGVWCEG